MRRTLAVIAVFALTIVLLFARAPDAMRAPQFWAEDAVVFWLHHYEFGFPQAVLRPMSGYLHVTPRLIAAGADLLPYGVQPVAFVMGAALVTGWAAATIASLALPLPLAASLGVVALLAVPGGETLANPTNLQWLMAPALPLIAATVSPAGRLARANLLAFVALASLSGPFSILMSPIWLWCMIAGRRDRFAISLATITLLAAVVQAVLLHLHEPPPLPPEGPSQLLRTIWVVLLRAVTEPLGVLNGIRAFLIACIGLALTAAFGRYASHRRACVAFAGLVLLAAAWKFRAMPGDLAIPGAGDRYFQIPSVMMAFCAVSLLFEAWAARLIATVGCVVLARNAAATFVRTPIPDCTAEWAAKAPEIGTRPIELRVSPDWILRIPAKRFSAGSR